MKTLTLTGALAATGALSAGAALAAWGHAELTKFQLHDLTVPIFEPGELRGDKEFRILHISDLHMIPGQNAKVSFVNSLADLRPDLVVNTGDNLSDPKAVPWVIRTLDPLFRFPGLFVFGTNDYWAPHPVNPFGYLTGKKRTPSYVDLPWKDMRSVFLERGWRDANQQRQEFQIGPVRLAAAGVDDPHHNLDDYSQIAGPPHPDSNLKLALLHAPEPRVLDNFLDDGYQLALAGHTHGGQVCLPGGRAVVTNCGIDVPRVKGLSEWSGMALHVSEGLGTSKYAPVRVFCRPAATILRLTEKSSVSED